MKNFGIATICAVSLTALGGCGSSSTTPPAAGVAPAPTFAQVSADARALQDQYTDKNGVLIAGATRATTADINSAANATYTGYVGGELLSGSDLVGTLEVDADFGANTATSTATGFIHETEGAYAGTLTGSGPIEATAPAGSPQVSSTISGNLTNGGATYVTNIALDGDFAAAGGDPVGAMAGSAIGDVGSDFLTGTFAAEK